MTLILPMPPSANVYWRYNRGRVHISEAGKAWKKHANVVVRAQKPVCIPPGHGVCIRGIAFFERNNRDIDNIFKPVLDLLAGLCYVNDKQVVRIEFAKAKDKDNPRIEIQVETA